MSGRNNGPAISLFSFQDIITSITGIMFLIVLMLMLLMLELDSIPADGSAVDPQLDELRRTAASLRTEASRQEADTADLMKQLDELRKLDPAELEKRRNKLLEEIRRLAAGASNLDEAALRQKREAEEFAARRKTIEEETRQLSESIKLKQQYAARLRKEVDRLAAEKLQRDRLIPYTVSRSSGKTPVLIECSAKGFRAMALGEDTPPADFPAGGEELLKWAKRRNPDEVFFFLLAKPSAFLQTELLADRLAAAGYDRGREVMPAEESTVFAEAADE